ncbi:isoprenyl transferase [uncultured Ruminococcus sp.]|uniref:isoprenyl transferase n=1 Tax=uncultured Ruminococcus sp. TaxID=165186 RepID=UPI00292FED17|nr:isoprenyl transferase [uncultured Ruminococcus sp.]
MALFKKKPEAEISLQDIILPEHVGIIMDGNGRWAKKRGLPRSAGHTAGAQVFRKIARYCSNIGIRYLTVYAFSTENWKRPKDEVDALMRLFKDYLEEAIRDFKDDSIILRFIGDRSAFSPELIALMEENETESKDRDGMVLNIAMNYGGRAELITAMRQMAREAADGTLDPDSIDEQVVSDHLYTKGEPDPDLIIRPSGENRTSNFLLWQSAYAEYVIMDVLWPDFKEKDLDAALIEYAKRNRRFGGV